MEWTEATTPEQVRVQQRKLYYIQRNTVKKIIREHTVNPLLAIEDRAHLERRIHVLMRELELKVQDGRDVELARLQLALQDAWSYFITTGEQMQLDIIAPPRSPYDDPDFIDD